MKARLVKRIPSDRIVSVADMDAGTFAEVVDSDGEFSAGTLVFRDLHRRWSRFFDGIEKTEYLDVPSSTMVRPLQPGEQIEITI
jgi:hypothetical protein